MEVFFFYRGLKRTLVSDLFQTPCFRPLFQTCVSDLLVGSLVSDPSGAMFQAFTVREHCVSCSNGVRDNFSRAAFLQRGGVTGLQVRGREHAPQARGCARTAPHPAHRTGAR